MPCIWGKHDKSQVFLWVTIVEDTFVDGIQAPSELDPPPQLRGYRALIDTGAQLPCITRQVAEELGLAPIGKVAIQGVSGLNYHNSYLFKVGFPFGTTVSPHDAVHATVHIADKPVHGIELSIGDGEFDVLLGMDIIGLGSLKIDGDGSFSFSF
jgi:hypothetical protein